MCDEREVLGKVEWRQKIQKSERHSGKGQKQELEMEEVKNIKTLCNN